MSSPNPSTPRQKSTPSPGSVSPKPPLSSDRQVKSARKSPMKDSPVRVKEKPSKEKCKKSFKESKRSINHTKSLSKEKVAVKERPSKERFLKIFSLNSKPSSKENKVMEDQEKECSPMISDPKNQISDSKIQATNRDSKDKDLCHSHEEGKNKMSKWKKRKSVVSKNNQSKRKLSAEALQNSLDETKGAAIKRQGRERVKRKESKEEKLPNDKTASKETVDTKDESPDNNDKKKLNEVTEKKAKKDWERKVTKLKEKINLKAKKLGGVALANTQTSIQEESSNVEEIIYPKPKISTAWASPSGSLPNVAVVLSRPELLHTADELSDRKYKPSTDIKNNNDNSGQIFIVSPVTKLAMPFWMDPSGNNIESASNSADDASNLRMSLNGEALIHALSGTLNLIEPTENPKLSEYHNLSELEYRDQGYFNIDMIFSNSLRSMIALNDDVKKSGETAEKHRHHLVPLKITLPTQQFVYNLIIDKTSIKDLQMTQKPFKESGKRLNSRA